ncbi:MAG: ATP-binding protein [Rhizonema sp. PD37]|nr:ATP-binding protein [Rhizonema sp. PD37]
MPKEFIADMSPPFLFVGSNRDLQSESTLQELSMYDFAVETSCTGVEVAKFFEKSPLIPGAILLEEGKYVGMISRRQLLEFLIRPYAQELFFHQPLSLLYSYVSKAILLLPETMPILTAMQLVLKRSPELFTEPLVVQTTFNKYKLLDVQELNIASWQIRGIEAQVRYERSQAQIIQNEKMASLGRLVDGVAHEILDPVNFIYGNLSHVSNYYQDLIQLIAAYEKEISDTSGEIQRFKEEIEFEFLEQDIIKVLASIRVGAERLKKLVTGLQNFCHLDEVYPKPTDLHACIEHILLLISSKINGEIKLVKSYAPLPPVHCYVGQLNQVFMNILSQAVDTLLNEAVRHQLNPDYTITTNKPQIEIVTKVVSRETGKAEVLPSRWVSIRIIDNSSGMSPQLKQQIIDSFAAEKRLGKETSLSVSYQIITSRHGGELNLRSEIGKGTEFEVLLPLV